jgi:hypothetical protein
MACDGVLVAYGNHCGLHGAQDCCECLLLPELLTEALDKGSLLSIWRVASALASSGHCDSVSWHACNSYQDSSSELALALVIMLASDTFYEQAVLSSSLAAAASTLTGVCSAAHHVASGHATTWLGDMMMVVGTMMITIQLLYTL